MSDLIQIQLALLSVVDSWTFSEEDFDLDVHRRFRSQMFSVKANNWSKLVESRLLCLGSQTTIDRLHWLMETVKVWSGPISVSLFVPDVEYDIGKVTVNYLRKCIPRIKEQVRFKKLSHQPKCEKGFR